MTPTELSSESKQIIDSICDTGGFIGLDAGQAIQAIRELRALSDGMRREIQTWRANARGRESK